MRDETRKRLTEDLLGEKWHEPRQVPDGESIYCVCGACHWTGYEKVNRTFSTPADAQVVKDALEKAGKWVEFERYAVAKYHEFFEWNKFDWSRDTFTAWLFSYTRDEKGQITGYRLCDLAGEFMTKGE